MMFERPFAAWPRWMLEILARIASTLPFLEELSVRVQMELWFRDVTEWDDDDDSTPKYPVAGVPGVQ